MIRRRAVRDVNGDLTVRRYQFLCLLALVSVSSSLAATAADANQKKVAVSFRGNNSAGCTALYWCETLGFVKAVPMLCAVLPELSVEQRAHIASALVANWEQTADRTASVPLIRGLCNDTSPVVRKTTLVGLVGIAAPWMTEILRDVAQSGKGRASIDAEVALHAMRNGQAKKYVERESQALRVVWGLDGKAPYSSPDDPTPPRP